MECRLVPLAQLIRSQTGLKFTFYLFSDCSWYFQSQAGPLFTFDLISNILEEWESKPARKTSLIAQENRPANKGPAHDRLASYLA